MPTPEPGQPARAFLKRLIPHQVRRAWRDLRAVHPRARSQFVRLWLRGLARPEDAVPDSLPDPPSVLFVCYGNILRSAAAEAMFLRLVQQQGAWAAARSAGVGAREGHPADPRGVRAAADLGLDLSRHRASPVTIDLVGSADLILVMDRLNGAELLARFPEARPRLRFLGAFGPHDADWPEIPDPYSSDEAAVRRAFARIEEATTALARALRR